MDNKEGIQLLPGTKKRLGIKVPGENRFLYIGSAILGAVLVGMFSLGRYENSLRDQIQQIDDQLIAIEQSRNKKDEADLKTTRDRLTLTSNLIKDHLYWTEAFLWIENLMQREIQIQNVAAESNGKLAIGMIATNYTVVARQIAAFLADDNVTNLDVGKMESNAKGEVEFNIEVFVDLAKIIKR